MQWKAALTDFKNYLQLERGMAANTVSSYLRDLGKLAAFYESQGLHPLQLNLKNLESAISAFAEFGISARSQARMISSLKSFFKYLVLEEYTKTNPAELLEAPKLGQKLPVYLEEDEVFKIIEQIDLSSAEGHRNLAIIETLYGCGLRVSELVNLRISNLFFKESIIRVTGKGDKERLVPINDLAIKSIGLYRQQRVHLNVVKGHEDFLFLNRRGRKLTRAMIFHIIKTLVEKAGIGKKVSPHTFRHSFATHLVRHGADLRAVQEMLGHESITTTEIYTHLNQQQLRDAIMKFHPRS